MGLVTFSGGVWLTRAEAEGERLKFAAKGYMLWSVLSLARSVIFLSNREVAPWFFK